MPAGKVLVRRGQLERAGQHVVRRDVVRDVDQRRVGADARAPRPSSRRRSDRGAEVGEQGDDRAGHVRASLPFRGGHGRRRVSRVRGLAEQHLAEVGLEQELLGDAQRLEHPLDVAVQQRPLLAARRGIRPVLQVRRIDDDVLRVGRRRRRRCGSAVLKNASSTPSGRRMRTSCCASGCGRRACRGSRTRPSTGCRRRCRPPAESASRRTRAAPRACPRARAGRCPCRRPRRGSCSRAARRRR